MIQPEPFMPDDLIRTRNWADLTAEEKLALKDVAATEEEFRLLKLMLSTTAVHDEVPQISVAVHERLKISFRKAHAPATRGRVIGWWKYAAAAAIILAVAGTIWITATNNKKETVVAEQPKEKAQPVAPKDTVKPLTPVNDTGRNINYFPPDNRPKTGPARPPNLRLRPVDEIRTLPNKNDTKEPAFRKLPFIEPEPAIAANINTSVKENSELLQLVAAVY